MTAIVLVLAMIQAPAAVAQGLPPQHTIHIPATLSADSILAGVATKDLSDTRYLLAGAPRPATAPSRDTSSGVPNDSIVLSLAFQTGTLQFAALTDGEIEARLLQNAKAIHD